MSMTPDMASRIYHVTDISEVPERARFVYCCGPVEDIIREFTHKHGEIEAIYHFMGKSSELWFVQKKGITYGGKDRPASESENHQGD